MEEPKQNGKKSNGEIHVPKRPKALPELMGLFKRLQMREKSFSINPSLFNRSTRSRLIEGLTLTKRLKQHDGCVNTIRWDKTGEMIWNTKAYKSYLL